VRHISLGNRTISWNSSGRAPCLLISAALAFLLGGCAAQAELNLPATLNPDVLPTDTALIPSPTIEATPLPPPPPTLVVCLANEPPSLYLYGETSREADAVLEALYDGPYDVRDYRVEPVILERMPSFENGDARIEAVGVGAGEVYWNPDTRQPKNLALGDRYVPAGCDEPGCLDNFWGGEVSMDRMVVDFHLRSGITWSDGQPLTAADSVFSFQVDADIDTPTLKYLIDRTEDYAALDESTTRWIGIPGFMDGAYQTNFQSPLPQHALAGFAAAELLSAPQTVEAPMGWGAYVIEDWQHGQQIVLGKNPGYFRASEGLPYFDRLIFRFLGDSSPDAALQQVITGECDVLDEDLLPPSSLPMIAEQQDAGRIRLAWAPGRLLERLELIISPSSPAAPSFFLDRTTREAIGRCIDREAIIRDFFAGLGELPDSYLPPNHPLYSASEGWLSYDPEQAKSLLREAGWDVLDGQGGLSLRARVVFGVEAGTPFAVSLLTPDRPLERKVAERIKDDLGECGVQVEIQALAPEDLFEPWPGGPAFGRRSDLVQWAWPNYLLPPCEMFSSEELASEDKPLGVDASGLQDAGLDRACMTLSLAPPDSAAYLQAARETQVRFREQIPAIPLYIRPRLMVYRPGYCGVDLDASSFTGLWNIEAVRMGAACE
jgi:peptide/nickel transport system substrate-binding protein